MKWNIKLKITEIWLGLVNFFKKMKRPVVEAENDISWDGKALNQFSIYNLQR